MTYQEKLKDERWLLKRKEILQRDLFTCKGYHCPSPKGKTMLNVHHLDYLPGIDPWDYPNDMLITLCGHCHGDERWRKQVEERLFSVLKQKGFMLSDLLAMTTLLYNNQQFTLTLLETLRKFQDG
jgi:5-methylcytosine-specific restriction endonuclease McrA